MKCKNPNCDRERFSRGLCSSCYKQAWLVVNEGLLTWEQLVERGKCLRAHSSKTTIRDWLLR